MRVIFLFILIDYGLILDFPLKQLPVLEITHADGKKEILTQSMSIGRYIARKNGLLQMVDSISTWFYFK